MHQAPTIGEKYICSDNIIRIFYFHINNMLYLVNEDDPKDVEPYSRNDFDKERILNNIEKIASNEGYVITPYQKEQAKIRKPYIDALEQLISEGYCYSTEKTYEDLIKIVPMPAGRIKHYSQKHICKWFKAYNENNRHLELSIKDRKPRCNQLQINDEECLMSFLYSGLGSNCNNKQMHRKYQRYVGDCRTNWKDETLNVADISTMRRRLKKITQLDWAIACGDKESAKKLSLTRQRKIRVDKALERVEIDCLHLNVALINDLTSEVITKVILYVAIDVKTRYPLSVVVQFGGGENSAGVLNLFRNMFIESSNELNAFGLPQYVIADNGTAFNNIMIDELTQALELSYVRTATGAAQHKPFIESFFNKLRVEFCEAKLEGYEKKYHNQELSSYQTTKLKNRVKITYRQFLHALNDHLIEYVNTKHKTANLVPQEAWNAALNDMDVLQPSYEEIRKRFHVESDEGRSIYERGSMSLDYEHFSNAELNVYRNEWLNNSSAKSPETTIYHDRFDLRSVTIVRLDEETDIGEKMDLKNLDFDIINEAKSFDFAKEKPDFNMFALNETVLTQMDEVILRVNPDGIKKSKSRKTPRSGKPVSSYEENLAKGMSSINRINQSNLFKATRPKKSPLEEESHASEHSNSDYKNQHDNLKEWD
ncbi:hypothetical protein RI845_16055 [Thalassotalea nanhaiensis]|uniref:Integrase catalytic domain-containing protein n=1 Tax=Thalassotalea nanhaiensis TaxID=3065648 RepID=A0ABY9TH18_9GAMM|nr:hypothetical protein RI845_16055 [Colwelliaceae bacterium SQ345]